MEEASRIECGSGQCEDVDYKYDSGDGVQGKVDEERRADSVTDAAVRLFEIVKRIAKLFWLAFESLPPPTGKHETSPISLVIKAIHWKGYRGRPDRISRFASSRLSIGLSGIMMVSNESEYRIGFRLARRQSPVSQNGFRILDGECLVNPRDRDVAGAAR
jgi:hypothetical protein